MSWMTLDAELKTNLRNREAFLNQEESRQFYQQEADLSFFVDPISGSRAPLRPYSQAEDRSIDEVRDGVTDRIDAAADRHEQYVNDEEELALEMKTGKPSMKIYPSRPPISFSGLERYLTKAQSQADRNTCTAFASIAMIELGVKKDHSLEVDLSEQLLHYHFFEKGKLRHHLNQGFDLAGAPEVIHASQQRFESFWEYIESPAAVKLAVKQGKYGPRSATAKDASFRAHGYRTLGSDPVRGARNYRLLESLISAEFAVAIDLAYGGGTRNGILYPAATIAGKHALLLYGYNSSLRYFSAKNSDGANPTLVSYEMIACNAIAAFIFQEYSFSV